MEASGTYSVELEQFEGPLDLLLHLVRKHELNVLDIPIAFVTERYLAYLDKMQSLDIDIAAEYLVMAATLCHIKSRELLPNPEPDEVASDESGGDGDEGDEANLDPRAELIRRLLEYQKYKDAASQLGGRPVVGRNVWSRGSAAEDAVADAVDSDARAPLVPFPVHRLIEAFDRLMRSAKVKVSHDVIVDRLSVSQRIAELTDRIETEGAFTFTSMFRLHREDGEPITAAELRHDAVVTFLALLEMSKLRLIAIRQNEGDDEIYIARAKGDDLRERMEEGIARTDEYR